MNGHYWVNEMFYSIQGEGVRYGTPNVFVRFKGCNMACEMDAGPKSPGGFDCDTEFSSGMKMGAEDIEKGARRLATKAGYKKGQLNVIFTGGEPGLQLDKALVDHFKDLGWYTAIETNGSLDVSPLGLDFICVSPKVAEHCVRQKECDEVRYVRAHGQGIPKPATNAKHKLLSPAFNGITMDDENLRWCMQLVLENPDWRLSVQAHKLLVVQ